MAFAHVPLAQFTDPGLRQCNLVAPMLPGHGTTQSPPLTEDYTHQAMAEDMALFLVRHHACLPVHS